MKQTVYPYLRGKQNELLALRELATQIADSHRLVPIIEPVKDNATTKIAFDTFVAANMPLVLVTNPEYGDLVDKPMKVKRLLEGTLWTYDNYIAAFIVGRQTRLRELQEFEERYPGVLLAAIYRGEPERIEVRNRLLTESRYYHHAFVGNRVPRDFQHEFPGVRRIVIEDHFKRQSRNADYPPREFFTDMTTSSGNIDGNGWGDFSIVGDHFLEKGGGAAHAVALHHVHLAESGGALDVSHFISDRTETTADTSGKTIEALRKLVDSLEYLSPDQTSACAEYRDIAGAGDAPNLGYMKKLAIKQHLETLLSL
jgi:hypothetical protein